MKSRIFSSSSRIIYLISLVTSFELSHTETPSRWKKLTTWWPDCSYDISCHSSEKWSQKIRTNWPWNWLTVLKSIKMILIQLLHERFQDDRQIWLCCFCMYLPPSTYEPMKLPFKISCLVIVNEGWGVSPLPQTASFWNKANFPFHKPYLFIDFWVVSSWTPLSVTIRLKLWYQLVTYSSVTQ